MSETVRQQTYALMRDLGLTTVFGNPGSTEEPFLQDFPDDFRYVLGLQEASVVSMADGYAQATGRPALVNLHTSAGVGNAMGNIATAFYNRTPLIITAGQQTRKMLLIEPLLTNVDATTLPRPYVKWSYETVRAIDAPAALLRAYATAIQAPAGPVFVSFPLDDWNEHAGEKPQLRHVSARSGPDPVALERLREALAASRHPAFVFGAGLDRAGGWDACRRLAESWNAAVWTAPISERLSFAERHPLHRGSLPPAIGPLAQALREHDVVVVIGAPVFRYYPYIAGSYLAPTTRLFHITDDPAEAARAPVGESMVCDALLACEALLARPPQRPVAAPEPRSAPAAAEMTKPMTPEFVYQTIASVRPPRMIVVQETPSNVAKVLRYLPVEEPASYYTTASGGLGFGVPAAVGIALAQRESASPRPVLCITGDGSALYSNQAFWTAAQLKLPMVFVIMRNEQYAILKAFAKLEKTAGVPGLDIPGLDFLQLAGALGLKAKRIADPELLAEAVKDAFSSSEPVLLELTISQEIKSLL